MRFSPALRRNYVSKRNIFTFDSQNLLYLINRVLDPIDFFPVIGNPIMDLIEVCLRRLVCEQQFVFVGYKFKLIRDVILIVLAAKWAFYIGRLMQRTRNSSSASLKAACTSATWSHQT